MPQKPGASDKGNVADFPALFASQQPVAARDSFRNEIGRARMRGRRIL
jgi:hypothetical protein